MNAILSSGFVGSSLFAAICICVEFRALVHRLGGQNRDAEKEIIFTLFSTKKAPFRTSGPGLFAVAERFQ
jgi:hypothetical protein